MTNRSIWRGHRFGLLVAAFALFPSNGSGTAVVASSRGPVVPGSGDRVFSQTRAGGLDVGRLRGNDAEAAVPNRYRLTLTGTMHVQSVEALNCDPGIARTTIEDSTVRIRTAGAIPVWVSTGGPVPPPPPLYRGRNFPGIYGFGHSAYMVLAVSTSVVTRVGTCGRPAREGRCAVTGTTLGRLESPRSPARRMYLVEDSISIRNGTCHADAHSTFLEDLFRRPAFANVPLTAIVRGRPRRFGVHLHQQRRDGDVTNTLDLSWRADIAPADAVVAVPSASTAVRGGRVTLDGSRSFSRIQTYSWKVARGGDCPPEVKVSPELLTGKRVSFPALCSFKARLTVDNEHASDSKTIAVRVEPRPWNSRFRVARVG